MELQDLYKQVISGTLSETDFMNMARNSPSKYVQTRADPEMVKGFAHSVLYMHLPTISLEDPTTGDVMYYCTLCNKKMNGEVPFWEHVQSQAHKKGAISAVQEALIRAYP